MLAGFYGRMYYNITNWYLKTEDEGIGVKLSGVIKANDYYLLERTDDSSVPGIEANIIYVGSLSNSGENIELYNSNNNLVDSIQMANAWQYVALWLGLLRLYQLRLYL